MVNIFDEMSWFDVAEALKRTDMVIVPVGVYEVHGPHLPLTVDILTGKEMAIRGAQILEKQGIEAVVGPTINQGITNWSGIFPGTMSIRPETFGELIKDVCRSLIKHGFKKIVLASGHAEPTHLNVLKKAAEEITRETGAKIAVPVYITPEWIERLPQEEPGFASHGGSWETSVVLIKSPNLINFERLMKLKPHMVNIEKAVRDKANKTMRDASPLGYFGDPKLISNEIGERAIQVLGEMVAESAKKLLESE